MPNRAESFLLQIFSGDFFSRRVFFLCIPAGAAGLHHELPDVHLLGFALLLPGRGAGSGLRTVRVRLRNTRGKAELCRMYFLTCSPCAKNTRGPIQRGGGTNFKL